MINPYSVAVLLVIFAVFFGGAMIAVMDGATLGTLSTAPMSFATATPRPEMAVAQGTTASPATGTATPIPPTETPIPPDTNATALAERVYTATIAALETAEQNDRVKQAVINDGLTKTPAAQATNDAFILAEKFSRQSTQTAIDDNKAAAEVARINAATAAAQKALADKTVFDARMQDVYFYGAIALSVALPLGVLLIAYAIYRRMEASTALQMVKARALAKMNNEVQSVDFAGNLPPTLTPSRGIVADDYEDDFEGTGVKRAEAFWFLKGSANGSLVAQHGTGETRAREVIQAMTDWCVSMKYATPAKGNKPAQWVSGHSNGDVARQYGFPLNTTAARQRTPPPAD